MNCEEAQEFITALVDHQVSDEERSLIDSHLKDCQRCQFSFEQEQALKREISAAGARLHAPAELRSKLLSDRRIFPGPERSSGSWTERIFPAWPFPRPALALALTVVLILPILYFTRTAIEPISLAALEIQKKIIDGEVSVQKASNPDELRKWQIHAVNGEFAPIYFDLSAMNVQPVGGVVQEIKGRKMLVTVYAGNGLSVTCFTFLGTEEDAPKIASVFFDPDKKMKFYSFSKDGFSAVLHREGKVICILVSNMSGDELLALVRAKVQPS
ncbi:MAG: zf-HC2 domain-containing protein [Deltaproteobacteria bacterium]|nr:zf-HC2 domain-containing protein [Deltaproteobacteria bacterium]MDZ4345469.1 zf-HC2 domain-containing protein [Candidatus Binatia bacterium]